MSERNANSLLPLMSEEVWAVDFEFIAPAGSRPTPVCMVALELLSGEIIRLWADELNALSQAPFDTGPQTVFVAYFASS